MNPVVADAADVGLIGRPRLSWKRIDWTKTRFHPGDTNPGDPCMSMYVNNTYIGPQSL